MYSTVASKSLEKVYRIIVDLKINLFYARSGFECPLMQPDVKPVLSMEPSRLYLQDQMDQIGLE